MYSEGQRVKKQSHHWFTFSFKYSKLLSKYFNQRYYKNCIFFFSLRVTTEERSQEEHQE